MSMNLIFEVDGGRSFVDFPYQTPTLVTYEVMDEPIVRLKLQLIREDVESKGWDVEVVEDTMAKVERLLANPGLTLGMI